MVRDESGDVATEVGVEDGREDTGKEGRGQVVETGLEPS